jgi:hypothetical protein
VDIYEDQSNFSSFDAIALNASSVGDPIAVNVSSENSRKPIATVNCNKKVIARHSRYFEKMLSSRMREGGEKTIRLITAYPHSLAKLLLSLGRGEMGIASEEELVELLYLADEYDMPHVMTTLQNLFPPAFNCPAVFPSTTNPVSVSNSTSASNPSATTASLPAPLPLPMIRISLKNAPLFLSCSAKLGLKLEARIFSGLAHMWWLFGRRSRELGFGNGYQRLGNNCEVLIESLKFSEK